eukprot:8383217-Pyramimonas_sp.AAC.1
MATTKYLGGSAEHQSSWIVLSGPARLQVSPPGPCSLSTSRHVLMSVVVILLDSVSLRLRAAFDLLLHLL